MNTLADREWAFKILNEQLHQLLVSHGVSELVISRISEAAEYFCTEQYTSVLLSEYVDMEYKLRVQIQDLFEKYLIYIQSVE